MPEDPDEAEVERLLIDFLNTDLDLSFTFLRTAQIDYDDPAGFELALSKCKQALKTIRRLELNIRNSDSRSEIHARADLLEASIKRIET